MVPALLVGLYLSNAQNGGSSQIESFDRRYPLTNGDINFYNIYYRNKTAEQMNPNISYFSQVSRG